LVVNIFAIGASTGGFSALKRLIGQLPADFPAAVVAVLHLPSGHKSKLAETLGATAKIRVVPARDGEVIRAGCVYIAVPDYHLGVKDGRIRLGTGPKQNFHRPSVDVLFSSIAEEYGSRAAGVVLTGALNDGTVGLMEIKRTGGVCIVQDPKDAEDPSMPQNALNCVPVDHCVSISDMGILFTNLAGLGISRAMSRTRVSSALHVPARPRRYRA
jgi:two-component system, chemotaxis family, protein-glutamate methylesterase/glutaminase